MKYEFLANVILKGKLEVLTGLHIGGSKEKLEIGGVDSPVIRDPFTNYPFIPGSSLKGKMRMLLEFSTGNISSEGKPYETNDINNVVCRLFGNFTKGTVGGPTRLITRDSFPDKKTTDMWQNLDSELVFTEYKPENTINRLTSEANPRFLERIVKGSFFDVEFIYSIYNQIGNNNTSDNGQKDIDNFKFVVEALRLLEHNGLGGNISRGYGQVKFTFANPIIVTKKDYQDGTENYKNSSKPHEDLAINKTLAEINTKITLQ